MAIKIGQIIRVYIVFLHLQSWQIVSLYYKGEKQENAGQKLDYSFDTLILLLFSFLVKQGEAFSFNILFQEIEIKMKSSERVRLGNFFQTMVVSPLSI